MSERPSLDAYFMGIAEAVAVRSDWPGTRVGCVCVRGKQLVSTGYNGTPAGYPGVASRADKRLICHAEQNAVAQAARHGVRLDGTALYVTLSPCMECAKTIVNAGIAAVVYGNRWDDASTPEVLEMLNSCGVRTRLWSAG